MKHETVNGHTIEFDPPEKVELFLRCLKFMVGKAHVTERQMLGLAYSRENPFLDYDVFPGWGSVTRGVLADPAYHIMTDLIFRKRVAILGIDLEKMASRYTMTVAEAAAVRGIHESAVRQAIAARRLASWVKGGQHYLDPGAVRELEVGTRGPRPRR